MDPIKVLVLGARGMLGHALFHELSKKKALDVYGSLREDHELRIVKKVFPSALVKKVFSGLDAEHIDDFEELIKTLKADVVLNCIGIIKQVPAGKEPLPNISLNAQLPHMLARICEKIGTRFIHFSTDCVFDGEKGNYNEKDGSNARDLYGRSKFLGEVLYPHCLTIRTSVVGHELGTHFALIEWFLKQREKVKGFTNAIFNGLPTVEMARVLSDFILPNHELQGILHVSSDPISKYDLLKLVAKQYGKKIIIVPFDGFICDRSLDSNLFRSKTGYHPPQWPALVKEMHRHYIESGLY
jgi:dTDP-4-dehydrorhamnose reductase